MARQDLATWSRGIEQWLMAPPRRAQYWRQKKGNIEWLIEIGYNQVPQTATAAYCIHSHAFDLLIYGKKLRSGGVLVLQAGQEREPFKSSVAYPEDAASVRHFVDTIAVEAPSFFAAFPDLQTVYRELVAERPRYPRAFPQALSPRQQFAAAVAFLLGKPWERHIEQSLDALKIESARKGILEVKKRLEVASG